MPSGTFKISFQPERHYFIGKLVQIPARQVHVSRIFDDLLKQPGIGSPLTLQHICPLIPVLLYVGL
ncbi:hypothetical protein SAMN05216404_1299, partial [Nitrosospira multiformis]